MQGKTKSESNKKGPDSTRSRITGYAVTSPVSCSAVSSELTDKTPNHHNLPGKG